MAKDVGGEDLTQLRLWLLVSWTDLRFSQESYIADHVQWVRCCMHKVCRRGPYCLGPVQACPAGNARVPNDSVNMLSSAKELPGKCFHGRKLEKIDQNSFELHAGFEKEADAKRRAIGFSERFLQMCLQALQRVFTFPSISCGEENVEFL